MNTTLAYCSPELSKQEQAISNVLAGTASWSITGQRLTITHDGFGSLVYVRAVGMPPTATASPSGVEGGSASTK
jgi:heat shock protein HslJ